jgi:peptide/nickel transport system substrate-binding protein
MRTASTRVAIALAAVAVFGALGSSAGARVNQQRNAAASGTLTVGVEGDPVVLDGALVEDATSIRVINQVFDGLVDFKPGTTLPVPSLATSWKGTAGGRIWTFNLRHGVKFQDNTPFNSAAVCYNFNRWYNFRAEFQNPDATYYWQNVFGGFKSSIGKASSPELIRTTLFKRCTTLGKYRMRLTLTRPSASFLGALGLRTFGIASPAALRKYKANSGTVDSDGVFHPTGSFATKHPIGTGPFRLKTWNLGEKIVLVRNPTYWGPKPKLSRLIFQPIPDNAARLQALQTGEVQAYDFPGPQDIGTIKKNKNLKVLNRAPFNVFYIGINQAKPPMNKLKVRQAVAYGLNRAQVVKAFWGGRGVVAKEFMPPGLFGYSKKVQTYSYNPSKAKSLLRSAGLSLPVKLDYFYFTRVRGYLPQPSDTFEAFKASLENSGFQITPHVLPFRPDYLSANTRGETGHIWQLGWTGDWGDPDDWLGIFFQRPSKIWGFNNPKIHKLLDRAEREPDQAKRATLYQQANVLIMKFLPGVPVAHNRSAMAARKNVHGLVPSPVQSEQYRLVSVG